ncbi:MAG TPA: DUF4142 domain-containing protein [Pyrinomonadaceae bacterium]|nr:DUF4142 domain-containing protein [Pyrinomonadaceae bacterium]
MNNRQLIKTAHVWALTALLALGVWAIAGKAGINTQNQNQNSNGNSNTGGATGTQAGMNQQDHKFIMDAAMGGMMEVELGRVAAQKGTSEAVKQFGQRMVDDHSKANEELMSLASSKGMTLPTALDDKHQKDVAKLSAMSGAEFDRAYSKMMLKDHEKDVKEFERQSTKSGDPELRAFVTKILPTLQEHLQMVRTLPGNESSGNSNNNSGGSKNSNNNGNSNRP